MYVPNNTVLKYLRHKLIETKGETDESTITLGDFNTPLSEMGKSHKQKIQQGHSQIQQHH